ncbi:hypothetical protein P154DRAFT_594137 [Amniculicola lignicola CBS 123094]|uniref:Uncharacterized protein n=1 Tax=Amniculicola lignicola CBS 123094 TaxID=1392246 RepID=A0A6A5WQI0_9PLEO|nr:hypothetical protein P154DRAFT_594137 [Amniculicola lignicola CBS 123094]
MTSGATVDNMTLLEHEYNMLQDTEEHDRRLSRKILQNSYEEFLRAYRLSFEYGLRPNLQIGNQTLWQIMLWHVVDLQVSHGLLEEICVKAVSLFLSHGADPFVAISYTGRDFSGELSVSKILETFFGQDGRKELIRIFEQARTGWRDISPSPKIRREYNRGNGEHDSSRRAKRRRISHY